MRKSLFFAVLGGFILLSVPERMLAQSHSLTIQITNQPENPVLFGKVSGDDFTAIDSAMVSNNLVIFYFPANALPGIYRLVFGKTTYAKLMNEGPQQLDLIFNNEDIEIQTDFKDPVGALRLTRSRENSLWYDFKSRQSEYEKALAMMEQEVDHFWKTGDSAKAIIAANEFNRIQLEWDLRIVQIVQQNRETFAAKLITLERTPLADAFLLPQERRQSLKKDFLANIDFTDDSLIQTSALTDKLFDFLVLFNEPGMNSIQRLRSYQEAVDRILSKSSENKTIDNFIREYLIHGFQVLEMPELVEHIESFR